MNKEEALDNHILDLKGYDLLTLPKYPHPVRVIPRRYCTEIFRDGSSYKIPLVKLFEEIPKELEEAPYKVMKLTFGYVYIDEYSLSGDVRISISLFGRPSQHIPSVNIVDDNLDIEVVSESPPHHYEYKIKRGPIVRWPGEDGDHDYQISYDQYNPYNVRRVNISKLAREI